MLNTLREHFPPRIPQINENVLLIPCDLEGEGTSHYWLKSCPFRALTFIINTLTEFYISFQPCSLAWALDDAL